MKFSGDTDVATFTIFDRDVQQILNTTTSELLHKSDTYAHTNPKKHCFLRVNIRRKVLIKAASTLECTNHVNCRLTYVSSCTNTGS